MEQGVLYVVSSCHLGDKGGGREGGGGRGGEGVRGVG